MVNPLRPIQTREYRLNAQRIVIAQDADTLNHAATLRIIDCAQAAIHAHGEFHLALSGGNTPASLHRMLASSAYRDQIDWRKVHIYFGDERYVPHDHPDSNYLMAKTTLLDHVPVPATQVHPIPTDCSDSRDCAQRYAAQLAQLPQQAGFPRFDLILLGMGGDGHTASLFPGTTILTERSKTVAAVFVPHLDAWRVSLTYPVLEHAGLVMILVSGAPKAGTLYAVFNEADRHYPIQAIRNPNREWYVDEAAAARLIESDVGISG